jgi:hypothetical protein
MPGLVGGQFASGLEEPIIVIGVGLSREEIDVLLDLFALELSLLLRLDDNFSTHAVEQKFYYKLASTIND